METEGITGRGNSIAYAVVRSFGTGESTSWPKEILVAIHGFGVFFCLMLRSLKEIVNIMGNE